MSHPIEDFAEWNQEVGALIERERAGNSLYDRTKALHRRWSHQQDESYRTYRAAILFVGATAGILGTAVGAVVAS